MSELSVRQYLHNDGSGLTWGYDKREADKLIAELEKKLDIYKRGWMENDRVNANQYAEIRHHKYKRCLAIANGCKDKINYWHIRYTTAAGYDRSYEKWKYRLLIKWRNRWLELAEKFKEAK